jgi:transcriptional regulator with XRE-family HTH domain
MSRHPPLEESVDLPQLGAAIRARRKVLRVSSTATAEAAGVSRVTLHRIEKGEPTVAVGAWARVMAVLGFGVALRAEGTGTGTALRATGAWLPVQVRLNDYPQLKALAWHVTGAETLRPNEAFDIYERHARHLDAKAMTPAERELFDALQAAFGGSGRV